MTSHDSPHTHPETAYGTETGYRLDSIGTTARRVSARRWSPRAPGRLIDDNRGDPNAGGPAGGAAHRAPPGLRTAADIGRSVSRAKARSRSLARAFEDAAAVSGKARTTIREPSGKDPSRSPMSGRSLRDTRWRTTLPPTDLPTTSPTRTGSEPIGASAGSTSSPDGGSGWAAGGSTYTITAPARARLPRRVTAEKSDEDFNRCAAGSTRARRRSGRQFATALATPSGKDGTTGASSHAQPKTVGLRPPAIVRLEGPLAHGLAPSQSGHHRRGIAPPARSARSGIAQAVTDLLTRTAYEVSTVRTDHGRGQTRGPEVLADALT